MGAPNYPAGLLENNRRDCMRKNKEVKKIQFMDENFTGGDGYRYDGWLQYTLDTGETISIPATYHMRKCKACGEIKRSQGLKGICRECQEKEWENGKDN
jgi:hypothetical protein